jgi:hypothetical protein
VSSVYCGAGVLPLTRSPISRAPQAPAILPAVGCACAWGCHITPSSATTRRAATTCFDRDGRRSLPYLPDLADRLRCAEPKPWPDVTIEHEAGWWQAAIGHLIRKRRCLALEIVPCSRLSEMLFMEVVRWQLSYATQGRRSWLAGLSDPQVGRALTLLHSEPARLWTVEELAQSAAMSMEYLTAWRMHLPALGTLPRQRSPGPFDAW